MNTPASAQDKPAQRFDQPTHECCGRCRFWTPSDRTWGKEPPAHFDPTSDHIDHGLCRRRPPVFIPQLVEMAMHTRPVFGERVDREEAFGPVEAMSASAFPGTWKQEWCGDFDWRENLRPMEGV